jgi:LytR cell envelope-related transcriptional attenuator
MSNDQPARRPPAKSSGGGAPMGSTISIVIAVVAVVVGFIILRNINDTGDAGGPSIPDLSSSPDTTGSTDSAVPTTATTVSAGPSTTAVPNFTSKVVVANASGIKGAAKAATEALTQVGFTMGDPTDAAGAEKVIAVTKVYYLAGGEATAATAAQMFSSATSQIAAAPMPTTVPVSAGNIGDALVLVMVGTDLANKPLPAIAAVTPAGQDATTVPSTVP